MPEVCCQMYNWVIADARSSSCQHGVGQDITEHEIKPCPPGNAAPKLIPLPGVGERLCALVG
jgi:hypothetical protein